MKYTILILLNEILLLQVKIVNDLYSTAQNYKNKQNFLVLASFAHSFALLIWTYL